VPLSNGGGQGEGHGCHYRPSELLAAKHTVMDRHICRCVQHEGLENPPSPAHSRSTTTSAGVDGDVQAGLIVDAHRRRLNRDRHPVALGSPCLAPEPERDVTPFVGDRKPNGR
jgi:hypothetical protein